MIQPGIYTDLSIQDYNADADYVRSTLLKEAKRSLKQYHWAVSGLMPEKSGSHFDFGNAFELALMDSVEFERCVGVMPVEDFILKSKTADGKDAKNPKATKAYKDLESEWLAANEGKYVIQDRGPESIETIHYMVDSCKQDPVISKLIEHTQYQLSLFWEDPQTGLRMKTRPDVCKVNKNVVLNIKTAEDASPRAFSQALAKYDYPLQACFEIQGCIQSGLMPSVDTYFWLVVEKSAPYNAVLYEFDQADIQSCMIELDFFKQKIADAQASGVWPGYSDQADNKYGILQARIPAYYFM